MDLYPASSLTQKTNNSAINNLYMNDLQQVSGMDGARAVITTPRSRIAVFDSNDDIFYIIGTDANNNKNIVRCRFVIEPEPKPEDLFASKSEIKELKGEIDNVQQSIRELTAAVTSAIGSSADTKPGSESGSSNKKFVPKSKGESKPSGTYEGSNGQ